MGSYWLSLLRSFNLKCPQCQQAPLYESLMKMHEVCPNCGLTLVRHDDMGGPTIINYSVTVVLTLVLTAIFVGKGWLHGMSLTLFAGGFGLVFLLLFARYAKSIWVNFLYQTKMIEEYNNTKKRETPHV